MLLGGLTRECFELTDTPVTAREPEQYEARRQQPAVAQVIDRGNQLLAGEVTGDTEDDERAWIRHARQPAVAWVAQGIARPCGLLFHRAIKPARPRRAATAAAPRLCDRSGAAGPRAVAGSPTPAGHRAPGRAAGVRR